MKARLQWLLTLIYLFAACDSSGPDEKLIFNGKWNWIATNGVETDGTPFHKDPESEGYDWSYLFYDEKKTEGKLQTYKDEVEDILYSYIYTVSSNPLEQKLSLTNLQSSSGLPEIYFWEFVIIDNQRHLYLRNAAYFTDDCCDLKLEHHFVAD